MFHLRRRRAEAALVACAAALATLAGIVLATDPASAHPSVTTDSVFHAFGRSAQSARVTGHAGELAVAYISADGPSLHDGQTAVVASTGGIKWTRAVRENVQYGDAEVWYASLRRGAVSVTATPAHGGYDTSLTVITYRGAVGIGARARTDAQRGTPAATLTTTVSGSLVAGVGMSWDGSARSTVSSRPAVSLLPTVSPRQLILSENADAHGKAYWSQQAGSNELAGTRVTLSDTAPMDERYDLCEVEIIPAIDHHISVDQGTFN